MADRAKSGNLCGVGAMAVDMFLKITDVKGESKDKSHPGEIEIESFSWGATQLGALLARDRCRCRQGLDRTTSTS